MSYNLFLDDQRKPKDVTWVRLPSVEWATVKCYDDFVYIITSYGVPERVSFDHDLADEHYKECLSSHDDENPENSAFQYGRMKEKTGFHCAKWLVAYCLLKETPFPEYYVHSMNPIGRENIVNYIENFRELYSKLNPNSLDSPSEIK